MTQATSITIPGYRVQSKLGQGGMATVYLAIQESFDREVALKIMSPFLNSDPSFTTRFVREARIVAQIHHASIVPVMDVGEHQSNHYLSMEYLPGGDLKQRIQQGKHGLTLAVNTCMAIAAALDVAHRKGFVHRDIKPENILFREDGTPVLTDFGIARAIDAGTSLTMAGMMVGTPNYMSPEQVKGQELDGRSDLYSLGIVFFETLTGTVPYRADSSMSLALKHLSDPLPALPAEHGIYQPFMDRLTAKDREDRFASGAEVTRALRLITEMAQTRIPAQVRPTIVPVSAVPTPEQEHQPTLFNPLGPGSIPGTASAPQPVSKTVQISKLGSQEAPPTLAPQKVVTPKPPRKPVFAPLAKAVMGALRSAGMSFVSGLSALKIPARLATLKSSTARWSMASTVASLRGMGSSLGSNKPAARYASWVAAGVAGLAVGFGGYLFARNSGPTMAAQQLPNEIVVANADLRPPVIESTPAPPAPEPQVVEPPTQEEMSPEVIEMLGEMKAVRVALVRLDNTRTRTERRLKQEADDQQAKIAAEEQRRKEDERADGLLIKARAALAETRFYEPTGSNAAESYRDILAILSARDPKTPAKVEATAALKKIADMMAIEIERNLRVNRLDRGAELLQRLRDLQTQHPQLAVLDVNLTMLRAKPELLNARQVSALERCDRSMREANEALDARPLTSKKLSGAASDFDAANKCTDAPGLETLKERILGSFELAAKTTWEAKDRKETQRIVDLAKREKKWFTPAMQTWENTLRSAP